MLMLQYVNLTLIVEIQVLPFSLYALPRASSLSSVSLASLNRVGLIFSQRWYRSYKDTTKTILNYLTKINAQLALREKRICCSDCVEWRSSSKSTTAMSGV